LKQVTQDVRSGQTVVRSIPEPAVPPDGVLVSTKASLISAGTEKTVVELARKSLLGKARERPDHVWRVLEKVRQEGVVATGQQVLAKLDEPMPLGYSAAGEVIACGSRVPEFEPGQRVAVAGPHAGVIVAGRNLCARIPEPVSFEQAAYASVAAIALEGVRLAKVTLGERVLVIGLGLIGQITVCLLKAHGCRVFGTDPEPSRLELAQHLGADQAAPGSPLEALRVFTDGQGVDAVVITAATSSNEPIELAADAARVRGRIVLVGVVGLNLPRPPFFAKELEFTVSASLGPGRGDALYEERGQDYPFGHVRWTARRNMEAALELMASAKLPVERLTTHRFEIEDAASAYDLITARREPFIGVLLQYPETARARAVPVVAAKGPSGNLGVSLVGAGNFARLVLLPKVRRVRGLTLRGVCSGKGMSAEHVARREGFAFATTDAAEIVADDATQALLIATRHDLHAELTMAALRAGKHVLVEKPLCLTVEELEQLAELVRELGDRCPILMVGFNRRFAPASKRLRRFMAGGEPLSISFRFVVPELPRDHWVQDQDVGGGRIVGEACHAIDTCIAFAGSPPVRVFAESVAHGPGVERRDDRVFLTLRHENGSISSVSYQAGGDKAGPTERVEVFGGGRTAVLEGWDRLELWHRGRRTRARGGKDRGHAAELAAFFQACLDGGDWPIPWPELYGTTWASLAAVHSLREGRPVTRHEGA